VDEQLLKEKAEVIKHEEDHLGFLLVQCELKKIKEVCANLSSFVLLGGFFMWLSLFLQFTWY